jgi:hypothetical protein
MDSAGGLWAENPFTGHPIQGDFVVGNGAIIQLFNPSFPLPANAFMDTVAAYGRIWMAYSDLQGPVDYPSTTNQVQPRQFYFDPTTKKFHHDGVGVANNATPVGSAASGLDPGDIAMGTRYLVTLFATRTGYISGWETAAIKTVTITDDVHNLRVGNIPISPDPNVTQRIIAITQAGASSAGPYFYIPADDFIAGLNGPVDGNGNNITKTVIDDNTTTQAFFNFPDQYLIESVDVTSFFTKGATFAAKSVMYAKTLRRLIWCGEDDDTFRISEPDDPETYFTDTGLNQPGQGDGGIAMCAREFRTELYFFKNNGAHLAVDTTLDPSQWVTRQRWDKVGPEGPWAIDVDKEFIAFAHRSGPYIFDGNEPFWIGYDISGNLNRDPVWDKINWTQAHKIYVLIDRDRQIVKFGVPYGQSTKVDREFICDYSRGWQKIRWSWDDATTTRAISVDRTQFIGPDQLIYDPQVRTHQVLHGMNDDSGRILYEDRTNHTIDGSPFVQEAHTAYTPYMATPGIYGLAAMDTVMRGGGSVSVVVSGDTTTQKTLADIPLQGDIHDNDRKMAGIQNERFSISLSNGGRLGDYWECLRVCLWAVFKWKTRSV